MVFLLSNELVISCTSCNRTEYFLGYLTKLLQNHTAYACDGEHLSLHCPRHSTISVQSAFYGQDYHMCSTQDPETRMTEPINCVAPTSLQVSHVVKVLNAQNVFDGFHVVSYAVWNSKCSQLWMKWHDVYVSLASKVLQLKGFGQQDITIGLWKLCRLPSVLMSLALETPFSKFPKIINSLLLKGWSWLSRPVLIHHTGPPHPQQRIQTLDRTELQIHWIRWHSGCHLACSMPIFTHSKGIVTAKQQILSTSADICISMNRWCVSVISFGLFAELT